MSVEIGFIKATFSEILWFYGELMKHPIPQKGC